MNLPGNGPQKWAIASAKTPCNAFAPSFDGSASTTGHYLLMDRTALGVDGVRSHAELALNYPNPTMYLKNAYHGCLLILDYFVNITSSAATYSLEIRFGADTVNLNRVYRIDQHMPAGAWRKAYAHIGEHFTPFLVDISGRLADGSRGAMAVDNVHFVNCSMPAPLAANQSCKADQYMCKKGRFCISSDSVCDGVVSDAFYDGVS